ncbi:MAG: 4Fe-4S dicluster domain-containing protein [Calditrichia bacterium]
MAHLTAKDGFHQLVERLNRFPQGAAPTATLFKILRILMSEAEASRMALLPIKPFTAKKAAKIWKVPLAEARRQLEELASRALLLDVPQNDETVYTLPPPMAGFFEFSMMRYRKDIDQKELAELFYQYMNREEDFIYGLFSGGETQQRRAFVNELALPDDPKLEVLDYERASEIIKQAKYRAVGVCYCRHKMQHKGQACNAPMDICMTFGNTAASLNRQGFARLIDTNECLDLLDLAYQNNLVQFGENVREGVNFICNCCGCCCEALIAQRRFTHLHPIHTTNFIPQIDRETCNGCGKCVRACPVEAMTLVSANQAKAPNRQVAKLLEEECLGCGVCVRVCSQNALRLQKRRQRVLTPANSIHRIVMMAIERGKLQELIFDNRALWSHRAMSAILGAILKLPPLKRALASEQLKSRYLETLVAKYSALA